ncbi:hypothetical protein AN964_13970 [Heyndrickxia shackletonii]|uniref:Uncharacterized protein n=1 Tax=Heyndrickxia shackletonii TaxID=157838 RepID=A0A0Q3TKI9_9BACI|nr:hypothetical protein [Heyndrickxia shackletonii]KQL54496.1 hypothetical protein AN964_13970 [Heyndrickxia shackletonii]NEY99223.1 hypothetical protein [Heyndrickxia shackletonii]
MKDLIKQFLPIIGVCLGFILSTLSNIIYGLVINRPKVKMELKTGNFNYLKIMRDNEGFSTIEIADYNEAEFIDIGLLVDIYNYGKSNTAIKDINIVIMSNKRIIRGFSPDLFINGNKNIHYSFNLPSNNVITMDLKLKIDNDLEDEILQEDLFSNEVIYDPDDKNRIQIKIIATDIKGKETTINIEPLSIATAF